MQPAVAWKRIEVYGVDTVDYIGYRGGFSRNCVFTEAVILLINWAATAYYVCFLSAVQCAYFHIFSC
jgi:hypothetical protein